MGFFDPDQADYFSDYVPDTLDDLKNMLYITNTNAIKAMNSMQDFVYSNKSYVEFKTPSIYENQNYNYLSGDTYRIPSMNYSVSAINDLLMKEPMIHSSFNGDTYKQFKIRASNVNNRDLIRGYLYELTSSGVIKLTYAEVDEMVVFDIDDSKYINISDQLDYQFTSLFGLTNGVEYQEAILIDKINVPLGKSILLQGKSETEIYGNDTVVFDKYYLYNQVSTAKQSIFDNLLKSTDLTEDTQIVDGSDSINDDYKTMVNQQNYRVYALMVTNAQGDVELKYRIVQDLIYNTASIDYIDIINGNQDYYEYYNSKNHTIIERFLAIESVYAVACIGGFHYGYNRSNKNQKNYMNVVGNIPKQTLNLQSDSSKTVSIREYVKNIHSNVVVNSIWDNYIHPVSCPVNMVRVEDEFIDMYCLDKDYLPNIKSKDNFINVLTMSETAISRLVAKNTLQKNVIENQNIFDINHGMFCYYSSTLNSKAFENVGNPEEKTYYYNSSNVNSKYNTSASNIYTYLGTYITKTDAIAFADKKPYAVGYGYLTTKDNTGFDIDFQMLDSTISRNKTIIRMKSKLK